MGLPDNRLALGTVQFGLRYGIANEVGQVSREAARAIVDRAFALGLDTLDTAMAYGESEQRLGEIGVQGWRVISKLPPLPAGVVDLQAWVNGSVAGSLARLGIPALHGLLLHRADDLLDSRGDALHRALVGLRDAGTVGRIGISIYAPGDLDAIWPRFALDLVQAPFNIVDRRLSTSGWLARLRAEGAEIHTRSTFLQGLLLMTPSQRPGAFQRWQGLWQEWDAWLVRESLSPLAVCLGFVMSHVEIDRVVVGVDSLSQFGEIVAAVGVPAPIPPALLMSEDADLINPSRWGLL